MLAQVQVERGVATLRVLDYLTHAHVVWVDDLVLVALVRILPGIFSQPIRSYDCYRSLNATQSLKMTIVLKLHAASGSFNF